MPETSTPAVSVRENGQRAYYWTTLPVGQTAQLVTLFCRGCDSGAQAENGKDVPLVAVLRDTLGDSDRENDRLTYVWLLSYSRLSVPQRMLSAVPFFYWRVGSHGKKDSGSKSVAPLMDLTSPVHPVLAEAERDILQWGMLDPMTMGVRATSRAYRRNASDHERLHLEEAISYLRAATPAGDGTGLTRTEIDTVTARLELRKRLLGGLVPEKNAARFGEQEAFADEETRTRNWELLRQCAEKTGLIFEPMKLAGTEGQYGVLWYPQGATFSAGGANLDPIWKLLNIKDPWTDAHVEKWDGPVYVRTADATNWTVTPKAPGSNEPGLIPLAVYSLTYPKAPLLMVDFRNTLHLRWHEMTQRSINEITSGIIGISHFTNWYYYVAADMYDFMVERHGVAMNQAQRLDCYAEFRSQIALDQTLNPELRKDIAQRVNSLAMNPLEGSPQQEIADARYRYARLVTESEQDGKLVEQVRRARRAELAVFQEGKAGRTTALLMHDVTLGLYTKRARKDDTNIEMLDAYRRVAYHLNFLDGLVEAGTPPEVAHDGAEVRASVAALGGLIPRIGSQQLRAHATLTLDKLAKLSTDGVLKADCTEAIASLERDVEPVRSPAVAGVASSLR